MTDEIVQIIRGTYATEDNVRTQAEEALSRLDKDQSFPVGLLKLSLAQDQEVSVRQSSSVLLKNWIDQHWSASSEKYKEPAASNETKLYLRQNLPQGLAVPQRPIRSVLSAALANIAGWDWPETWPELVPSLLQALDQSDPNMVDGALRTLREFSADISDEHAPVMLGQILPRLINVMMGQNHPISISRSLQILTNLTAMCGDLKDTSITNDHFASMLEVFRHCIQKPIEQDEDWCVKRDTFKCLTHLVIAFPKQVSKNCASCFEQCWSFIQSLSVEYSNTAIKTEDFEALEDSDGETGGVEGTITALLDFVTQLFEHKAFKKMVQQGLPPLLNSIMTFLQPSASQVETWRDDPDKFVEDEDDDGFTCSIRTSALDLLLCVAKDFMSVLLPPLLEYVAKSSDAGVDWQQKESAYYIIGSISEGFDEETMAKFNIEAYLEQTVLADLQTVTNPFLLGRSLWFAGRFADKIRAELINQFLTATVAGLGSNQHIIVRIQASRAVFEFISKMAEQENEHLLKPHMQNVIGNLIEIAAQSNTEVLCLILEVLTTCVTVEETVAAQFAPQLSELIVALIQNKSNDPQISSIVEDLVESVAKINQAAPILITKLVPYLTTALVTKEDVLESNGDTSITNTFISTCLDITTRLVRYLPKPIPVDVIKTLYPLIIEKTLKSNDTQIIQSGGETVRGFFASAGDQICQMEGGLDAAERVILHLLAPDQPEFSASFAGRLVTLIVLKTQGANIQNILSAVLIKLNTVTTLTVQQSLLLVFARLAIVDPAGLISFLEGAQATQPLLQLWLDKQADMFGAYERRVTVAGLCKLIERGCVDADETIGRLTYNKKVVVPTTGRQTRSKKQPEQFEQVQWLSQAMTIVSAEWSTQKERDTLDEDDENDDEDDDYEDIDDEGESDRVEEINVGGNSVGILLSDLLACRELEEFEGEEEEDVKADPIHDIDICEYVSKSMLSVSQTQMAQQLATGFDKETREMMTNVLKAE